MNDTPTPKEGFLRRWARLKATPELAPAAAGSARLMEDPAQPILHPAAPPAEAPAVPPTDASTLAPTQASQPQAPTLEDVARLTPQSDYSAFVAGGVSPAVRRLALRKLFADPNFAVMDGLDIYIADYTKASPLTDAMLASLRHAPGVLSRLLGKSDEAGQAAGDDINPDTAPAVPDGVPSQYPAGPDATADSATDSATDPELDVAMVTVVPTVPLVPMLPMLPVVHASMPQEPVPSPQGNA